MTGSERPWRTPPRPAFRLAALALALLLAPRLAGAATVVLKNSWLKAHKNRVTQTSPCHIDQAKNSANSISNDGEDGDLHMACRCDSVGLPMVAEIVNAAQFHDAVVAANDAEQTKQVKPVTGVWRLWLEHPPSQIQTQGAPVPVPTDTHPDHSFEIHPITRLAGIDLTASFKDIPGYTAYGDSVFSYYEGRVLTASRSGAFTSIEGSKAVYNYAGFRFTVAGKPQKKKDGYFVAATIDGKVSIPRRMVIADSTSAAALIKSAKKGDRFKALGIPRIDLSQIDKAIVKHPGAPVAVTGAYEMIIVGMSKAP